jgi:hypothetical protein
MLIARIYEVLPLICPECGSEMRLIAFITEEVPIRRILAHLDEPVRPPPILRLRSGQVSSARSPPVAEAFDWDQSSANALEQGEPAPEFEYDQTVSW